MLRPDRLLIYYLWCAWTNHKGFGWNRYTARKGHQAISFRSCKGCNRVHAKDAAACFAFIEADIRSQKRED